MYQQGGWQGQPQQSMDTPQHPSADPSFAAAFDAPPQGAPAYGYSNNAPSGAAYNPQGANFNNVEGGPAPSGDAGMMQGMIDGMMSNPSMVSNFAKAGFGAYGEKYSNMVSSTASKYFSGESLARYFSIDQRYVLNKLRLLACPMVHKGSWTRITENVAGGMTYKPPRHDINAPDLYIPIMGLGTYCVLVCIVHLVGDRFNPESLRNALWYGCMAWVFLTGVLWVGLKSIATAQVPIKIPVLDLMSYSGYAFVSVDWAMLLGLAAGKYGYYIAWLWGSSCMAVFVVKTMKRIIFAEARHYGVDSKSNNYHLLVLALLQYPVAWWLSVLP